MAHPQQIPRRREVDRISRRGDRGRHPRLQRDRVAVDAARAHGLEIDFQAFGSALEGESPAVLDAVDAVLRAAIGAGATRVSYQVTRAD